MADGAELPPNCCAPSRRWSAAVSQRTPALDLEPGVFTWQDPSRIAASLLASSRCSQRRRGTPLASAMAMLCFYINRAGSRLNGDQRQRLEQAKAELRRLSHP